MKKQALLKEVLAERLKGVKLGIIVKSIRHISPVEIIKDLSVIDLYVSIVGYDELAVESVDGITLSTRIEDAVLWSTNCIHWLNSMLLLAGR